MACNYKYKNNWYSEEEVLNLLRKENSSFTTLYNNLIKELETSETGRKVFEQVKRDYKYKEYSNKITEKDNIEKLLKGKELLESKDKNEDIWKIGNNTVANILQLPFGTSVKEALDLVNKKLNSYKYTLEEQQEEAIVTLLGLMAADKLDAKKDATLISKLKELWKQISDFVRSLLRQDGIKIDELPITTTLNDLAEIMAYGNNKIILPGYKVEYSTPLGNKYDTLEEVNSEISDLADADVEVDLSDVKVKSKNKTDIFNSNKEIDKVYSDYIQEPGLNFHEVTIKYKDGTFKKYDYDSLPKKQYNFYRDIEFNKEDINSFIEKNKEYEQSKEIIEQWKKENNIQYDPEEVYSRGQEFYHIHNAYSRNHVDTELWIQNLLENIQDKAKIGAKIEMSFATAPKGEVGKGLQHHNKKTKQTVYITSYPKSEDIAFVSQIDNHTSSFTDLTVDIIEAFTNQKNERAGIVFTKSVPLRNLHTIQPNLATAVDDVAHHNEIVIGLTPSNFRISYEEEVPYHLKKLIDNFNKILDDKYGKLVKPEIKKYQDFSLNKNYDNFNIGADNYQIKYYNNDWELGVEKYLKNGKEISDIEYGKAQSLYQKQDTRKQPTQTKSNTTSIESVKNKFLNLFTTENNLDFVGGHISGKNAIEGEEFSIDNHLFKLIYDITTKNFNLLHKFKGANLWNKISKTDYKNYNGTDELIKEQKNILEVKINNFEKKEYTSQAETNLKIAALKEVARKYPRSLITSKVVPINSNIRESNERNYSKINTESNDKTTLPTLEEFLNLEQQDKDKSDEVIQKLISKLAEKLNIDLSSIEIIDEESAKLITKDAKNKWSGQGAFYYKGKIYFVKGKFDSNSVLHEFMHPLVRTLANENPELFNKLYNELLNDPELKHLVDEANEEYLDDELSKEEAFVKALTYLLNKVNATDALTKENKSRLNLLQKILYAFKQLFRKITSKKDFKDLSLNTSLRDLTKMIVDNSWDVDTSYLTKEDLVAYENNLREKIKEFEAFRKSEKGRATVYQQLRENNSIAISQLKDMVKSENYEDLKVVLSDFTGIDSLTKMKQNMSVLSTEKQVLKAANDRIDELEDFDKRVEALVLNMDIIDQSVTQMKSRIDDLKDEPDQRKALNELSFYNKNIKQWSIFIDRFLKNAEEVGIPTKSLIIQDALALQEKIKRGEKASLTVQKNVLHDILFEMWEPINQNIEKEYKETIDKLNSQQTKLEPNTGRWKTIEALKQEAKQKFDNNYINKEKMLDSIVGKLGDIGDISTWMENYSSIQDPAISSFSEWIRKHMSEVNTELQYGFTDFAETLKEITDKLGVSPSNLTQFGEGILHLDTVPRRDPNTGKLVPYKVWSLLSEFKDYKYELKLLNETLENAREDYEELPSEENKEKFLKALKDKNEHTFLFFNNEFIDEYYEADQEIKSTPEGLRALQKREDILNEIMTFQNLHIDDSDKLENMNALDELWRKYSQLYSKVDEFGMKKSDEELKEVELLKAYRNKTNKFYTYSELPGFFQAAANQFRLKEKAKIEEEIGKEDPSKVDEELEKRFKNWLKYNTRQAIDPSFYEDRMNILNKLASILNKDSKQNIDPNLEAIIDSLQGRKDNNGQPIATEMTDEMLNTIKGLQEKYEEIKRNAIGISGLSKNERIKLDNYWKKLRNKEKLSPEEREKFTELKNRTSSFTNLEQKQIKFLFKLLNEMQERIPTDYYMNVINEWNSYIKRENGEEAPSVIEHDDIYDLYRKIDTLLEKNEDFKKWFLDNHIKTLVFDSGSGELVEEYRPTDAWTYVKPKDEKYIKTTQLYDEEGNVIGEPIQGVPSFKYHKREVKNEYKTGYDSKDDTVDESKFKDLQGNLLPRSLNQMEKMLKKYPERYARQEKAYDHYINRDYHNLDSGKKELLDFLTQFHLNNQLSLEEHKRLGLELPRYRVDRYERLKALTKDSVKEKVNSIKEGISSAFLAKEDDYQEGDANYKEDKEVVDYNPYNDYDRAIPITGRSFLEEHEVSKDIVQSLLLFYQSSTKNKKLQEIQPIANAMRDVINFQNPADLKKVTKANYRRGVLDEFFPGDTNNRAKVVNAIVESIFEGKDLASKKSSPALVKGLNQLLGMSSFSFFAFDITSAMKNFLGAQFQIALEGAGSKYFNYKEFHKARPWAWNAARQLSMQIYSKEAKTLDLQLIDMFDAVQGYSPEKFAERLSRSVARDATRNLNFTTSFRKWLEIEATLQLFGAIMKSTKVEQVIDGKKKIISYIDAWEIDPNTKKIKLKEGIDKEWDINGSKFFAIQRKNHEVSNFLQGAYAKMDQPMAERYVLFRTVSSMRKFFTKMFMHRFAYKGKFLNPEARYNLPTQTMHMGYYMQFLKTMRNTLKFKLKNLFYLNKEEVRAMKLVFLDFFKMYLTSALITLLWGYDDDDKDRWNKRREISGAMPWFGLTNEKYTENFNVRGWLANQALLLAFNVQSENEAFIPFPGAGMKQMASTLNESSVGLAGSLDNMVQITDILYKTLKGDAHAYYQKPSGAMEFQQEGVNKTFKLMLRQIAIKGKWEDPVTAAKNYRTRQLE